MICSSVYRFFMSVLSSDGLYLDQVGPEIGGQVITTMSSGMAQPYGINAISMASHSRARMRKRGQSPATGSRAVAQAPNLRAESACLKISD